MLLWVDDIRKPRNFIDYAGRVKWAENFEEAVGFLHAYKPLITEISLDNDLGEDKQGKDVLLVIEEMVFQGDLPALKTIYIHSHNPAAVRSMQSAAESRVFVASGIKFITRRA